MGLKLFSEDGVAHKILNTSWIKPRSKRAARTNLFEIALDLTPTLMCEGYTLVLIRANRSPHSLIDALLQDSPHKTVQDSKTSTLPDRK